MKKLLILGANYTEINIINAAKEMGVYTIVTDDHVDWELSPAKNLADEAWNISWSDIDSLERICIERQIDGVYAGFSEFRVDCMIQLTQRLGLPCAISKEQLEVSRDKKKFKRLCREFDIPTVPEYSYELCNSFPVIIKPVDRAGSIGVNVAYNKEQFEKFYQYAYSLSPTKNVIIEDFIKDGIKFDVYYYVKNSEPYLLGTSDTIMCDGSTGAEFLQKAWTFPSAVESEYIANCDANVKRMIRQMGVENCYITMSAFSRKHEFYFFEAGFRLSGDLSFNYYKARTGIDYVQSQIAYALSIPDKSNYVDSCELPSLKSVILNFFGVDGANVSVCENGIANNPNVIALNIYVKNGDTIKNKTKVLKKVAMATLAAADLASLIQTVDFVNSSLKICDCTGNDVIYEKLEGSTLKIYMG